MKKFLSLILFLGTLFSCNGGTKENKEIIEKKVKNLSTQNEVIKKSEKIEKCDKIPEYDLNVTKITLKNKGISDIKCLAKYKNLRELDLRWNKIKNIEALGSLEKLEVLRINFNQITDIKPILNLKNLRELWLHNNKIKDIRGIGKLSELKHLDVSYNPLEYGIEEIPSLKRLKRFEIRKTPKKIVDYVYNNYQKFMFLDEIYMYERVQENIKKRDNEVRYPNFSEFEGKIQDFETYKTIKDIEVTMVSEKNVPQVMREKILEYKKEHDEDEDNGIFGIGMYKNGNYSAYSIRATSAYGGYTTTYFLKDGKIFAEEGSDLYSLLESPEGNNLYLATISAHGRPNFIIVDFKRGTLVEEEREKF